MTKIAVLVIHGMGTHDEGYSLPMIKELKSRVEKLGQSANRIATEEVHWSPILAEKQSNLFDAMNQAGSLDYLKMRRFVLCALGDAVGYRKQEKQTEPDEETPVYDLVHEEIARAITNLRAETRIGTEPDAPEAPLFVIGHSLGCHMISNFIWDRQDDVKKGKSFGNSFEDLKTLTGLHTIGCNIPLFTLAYKDPKPITFPVDVSASFPGASEEELRRITKWMNYYDPDDILGWPLRPIGEAYEDAVAADVAINAGGWTSSWNPLSHSQYWTDNDFTKPVARHLAEILALL